MTTTKHCPQCGTLLPADVPNAQCPKCMLGVGLGSQAEAADATAPTASEAPPPAPADLGKHFPQLEILELLGQGGMGIVYKARQPRLDRLVALKILPTGALANVAFADRFSREARTLARLTHPNIVGVYDFGEADGIFYLIMEYVDGANLRELERSGHLGPAEALKIVPAICDALQYAHDQGVIHRDIKPENVLIDKQGRVKIADFGLAKILGRPVPDLALTRVRQVMGTPNYMAPEQIEHPLEVDHRADIYSLGVVIYEMLTGELPIGHFQPPSQRVEIDARIDQVVLRALARERERRYQKVSEVKTDVENIAAGQPPAAEPVSVRWLKAKRAVKGPAIGLVATGILNWVMMPLYIAVGLSILSHQGGKVPALPLAFALMAVMACSSFMIFAGLKMKALEAYTAALIGSIMSILISPGNLVGLPIGIWALVTLTRREMKAAFGKRLEVESAVAQPWTGSANRPPADGARKLFFTTASVFMIGCGGVILLVIGSMLLSIILPAIQRARHQAQEVTTGSSVNQSELVRSFTVSDPAVAQDLEVAGRAWFINCTNSQTVRLFEVANPGIEQAVLVYRAQLKTEDLQGRAFLEMWCRFADGGEYFSRGLNDVLTGSNDWGWHQTPFALREGQQPDLIKLNLVVEGAGKIWIRDVELRQADLK